MRQQCHLVLEPPHTFDSELNNTLLTIQSFALDTIGSLGLQFIWSLDYSGNLSLGRVCIRAPIQETWCPNIPFIDLGMGSRLDQVVKFGFQNWVECFFQLDGKNFIAQGCHTSATHFSYLEPNSSVNSFGPKSCSQSI